ncbi:CoA-transferase [Allosalinactinospora lopnorensis]|uniref:CoA-transferase n=1 Tax=Allosalinactinospora lopnorensis TaxID=1352348 RepID=UPI000623EF7D|nr:CoA-transferase [Allosalinactinospora lopnorensis]
MTGTTPRFLDDVDTMCVDHLRDGMAVHVASTMSRPNAMLMAIARSLGGRARFTISCNAFHANMHALVMAGVVRRAITCFAGDTYPSPRPNPLYADLAEGVPFPVEEWSLMSLAQRLVAGATGAPVAISTSLIGTDLERGLASADPPLLTRLDGERAVLLPELRPDVTLLHAACADRQGNLYLYGPLGEGWWGAMAAREGVLATAERVVEEPPEGMTRIPADRAIAITPCEFGAHPQGIPALPQCGIPGYLDDYDYLTELAEDCRSPRTRKRWFTHWVTEVKDHYGYRARTGKPRPGPDGLATWPSRSATAPSPTPAKDVEPTWRERHIVLAARAIVDRVLEGGHRTLVAGIGVSHVATWLAAQWLRDQGHPVQVHAELGLIDMRPEPGDVFLFSQRHVANCGAFGSTLDVLGALTPGTGRHTLGVLSAGEIDARGRINSSRTSTGGFLVGSGGANDFASRFEVLVVAPASPKRYVERTGFVTCPGDRVGTVVSQYGRLTREHPGEDFRLRTWCPPFGRQDADPLRTLRDSTRWPLPDSVPVPERPIDFDEVARLRALDPEGIYR